MNLILSAKNILLTDGLKTAVEKRISKLGKYFNGDVDVHVTLSVEKTRHIIEVTIPFNGIILRGEEVSQDMYTSIDDVVNKIERQIRKQKTRLKRRIHDDTLKFTAATLFEEDDEKVDDGKLVRNKRFNLKPMNQEEAILQMELLGHDFFVYKNDITLETNVVYKRKDGNYGAIEPEF